MWISSSPNKNRSDRGRIDVFFRGLNWILKASLLILALASFSVAAASELPKDCYNRDTCFAKNSNELRDGPRDDIGFEKGEISWSASEKSPDESKMELYKNKECGKLSFIMDTPEFAGSDKVHTNCKFSMLYNGCKINIKWSSELFKLAGEKGEAQLLLPDSSVKIELEGGELKCNSEKCNQKGAFCGLKTVKDGGWCKFDFAFKKNGSCDGTIRFDKKYKLLAKVQTTAAPDTSPTTEASSLAPWIIALIVVIPLLLVLGGIGFLVFWFCFRKRRGSPQNMAEKGKAGSDYQCETIVPTAKSTQNADRPYQSESAPSSVHSKKDRKEEERSKRTSQNEVTKTVSQKKQNVPEPAPSPSPLPENKPNRILAPDELYEPLGDPDKAVPMHLSEKKISEKKPGRIKFTGRNREKAEAIRKAMEEEKKKKQVT